MHDALARMRAWQTKHKQQWAKALLAPPEPSTIARLIRPKGCIMIMGSKRAGKTGLAMEIGDHFHNKRGMPGAVCYPEAHPRLRHLLPPWVKIVTSVKELPGDSFCVVDEASQVAHARRAMGQGALDMDALVSLSEQRNQLIIVIGHHSRKLDINDIQASDLIIWKCPTLADTIWERDELQPYVLRAWEYFQKLDGRTPGGAPYSLKQLKSNYAMDLRKMKFYAFQNGLPDWWSQELSTVFKLFETGIHKANPKIQGRRKKHDQR